VSLLQIAGRVNRNGLYPDARIVVFCLADDKALKQNPEIKQAAAILRDYFERGLEITPALSTRSIADEIRRAGLSSVFAKLLKAENQLCYKTIAEEFRVIDSDTCLAIVDGKLAERVREREQVEWRELQRNSVHIAAYTLHGLHITRLNDELFYWDIGYDKFIGYMLGVLQAET
jgi:hypothetical protein